MHRILLLLFVIIFPFKNSFGVEKVEKRQSEYKADFKTVLSYLIKGSYTQFTTKNNLIYAGLGTASLWYSFEHDDRLIHNATGKDIPGHIDFVGDMGIVLSFPLLPIGIYFFGKKNKNSHLVQFAMEYTASMYLALFESGLLSYIPVHERPDTRDLSFWEEAFRSDSSFPSGHIIPYSTLFFKTLQFYGPYYAAAPLLLTVWASMQRVREGRHYVSDVVGAFFLSAFASEGIRRVAKYKKNHRFYRYLFERNLQLGLTRYKNTYGPRLSFEF